MKHLKAILLCSLLYIGVCSSLYAQDSMQVSLLTCSPGEEVYELYGHTAIRCTNFTTGDDWVFNYGLFSFEDPGFIVKFVRGECDYEVGYVEFPLFEYSYQRRGSAVIQQVLNLTEDEKQRLFLSLAYNCRPEHKKYRYNFLYDNCTTRARDRIEKAINGKVIYKEKECEITFREITHQYTFGHPWAALGNDLCLGAGADKPITLRQQMFAPFYMKDYAQQAVIKDRNGNERSLVLKTEVIIPGDEKKDASTSLFTPMVCVLALLAFTILLEGMEWYFNCRVWIYDVLLLLVQGGVGCVVAFLFFFSSHPTVDTNWQIIIFNPLPLLLLPVVVYSAIKRKKTWFYPANAALLTLFILFSGAIPQDFDSVIVPLALTLLLRSLGYIEYYRRNRM